MPRAEREAFLQSLSPDERSRLLFRWEFWARDAQLAPEGNWRTWLLLAGRGFGKTRTVVEWAISQARRFPGSRGALVARTASDVRDVLVDGESGILAVSPPSFRPCYQPSKRRIVWPNGSQATTFTGEEPDQLRGPQHHWAICDELASWRRPQAWDMLMFGLRLGDDPRVAVATTPRPVPHIKELLKAPTTVVTRGSSYENRGNLAEAFYAQIIRRYEGTRLGRQELLAEILEDNPGALWTREIIERARLSKAPDLVRIVVAVDPQGSEGEEAAETGIVVVGRSADGQGYVLDDRTIRGSPEQWARQVIAAYHAFHADLIVAEANNGGEMVRHTIRTADRSAPVKLIYASRGKRPRAEPVSALYEQGRVHHLGCFAALEDQMCEWVPDTGQVSPDRMDALVWAATELLVARREVEFS